MSGYCPSCGNTLCVCKEIEQEEKALARAGRTEATVNDPTASELARRLRALTRYSRNAANDGDGRIDTWDTAEDDGEYVLWADVQKLAEEIESGKATK